MKKNYTTILFLLFTLVSFGQIAFNENIISDRSLLLDGPESVCDTDLDGDGDLDVLVTSSLDDRTVWYENLDGNGNFSLLKIISADIDRPNISVSEDFDGDGDMDVLIASANINIGTNRIAWFKNDGLGDFDEQNTVFIVDDSSPDSPGLSTVSIGDIDNDGDIDIVAGFSNDLQIVWFENDGQGNFGSEQLISDLPNTINGPTKLFVVDMDDNGSLDIIWTNYFNIYVNFNNNGLADFSTDQLIYDAGVGAFSVGDFDGDGDMDVVLEQPIGGTALENIGWLKNNTVNDNYSQSFLIEQGDNNPFSFYTEDYDGDGDIDILAASPTNDNIFWYENTNGSGDFSSQQLISSSLNGINNPIGSDIDNDGDIDIIAPVYGEDRVVQFQNLDGLGDFGTEIPLNSSVNILVDNPVSLFSVDLDSDGDQDVLFASLNDNKIAWFENIDGNGLFSTQQIISNETNGAYSVYASDIDGDGDMDVLSASRNDNKIAWFENLDGLGNFSLEQIITSNAVGARSVYASDMDGDGDIDVLSASESDDKIAWYENTDGQGLFGTQQIISTNANGASFVFTSDIDGDGDIDVLSASQFDDKIAWYENTDALGSFGDEQIISNGADFATSVYASDIDGDGDMDVLSSSRSDDKIAWYQNLDGQGTFSNQQIISSNANFAQTVHASDIDGDGDMDVLSASQFDDKIAWYENTDGQGSFGSEQVISNSSDAAFVVYAADIDGDGDMDVLSASTVDDKISWYKNLGFLGNEFNGFVLIDTGSGCSSGGNILANILISTENDNNEVFSTFSNQEGYYQIAVNEGLFTTQTLSLPNYYSAVPFSVNSEFIGLSNLETIDFCLEPTTTLNDLSITIYPSLNDPRPGFDTTYQLVYKNIGTTQLSGSVSFEFDDTKLQFLTASETVSSQISNTLTFDYTDLNPFETRTIDLEFNVFAPPIAEIGDLLLSSATINPISGDETEDDNIFELQQTVIGSYDPNDITCLEGDQILLENADKYLHYLIRFQNTGTASAINVRVENILDDKLDWTTMQLESLSHDGRVEIVNGSEVSFIFDNINLPDSTNDEPNSHGYIAYKIKPRDNVVLGDIFYNTAAIYFDFNPPIITNTYETEIVEDLLSVSEFENEQFKIFPNPTNEILYVQGKIDNNEFIIVDVNGRQLKQISNITNQQSLSIDVSELYSGLYFLRLRVDDQEQTFKFIKN